MGNKEPNTKRIGEEGKRREKGEGRREERRKKRGYRYSTHISSSELSIVVLSEKALECVVLPLLLLPHPLLFVFPYHYCHPPRLHLRLPLPIHHPVVTSALLLGLCEKKYKGREGNE